MIIIYGVLIFTAGYLLARLVRPDIIFTSHIILFGLGTASLISFGNLILSNSITWLTIFVLGLISILTLLVLKKLNRKIVVPIKLQIFDLVILLILLVIAFQQSYGYWDAWAMWNTKAKFIAAGTEWKNLFSPDLQWMHPDYPLFLPTLVASSWVFSSSTSYLIPLVIAVLFTWAIYLLLKETFLSLGFGKKSSLIYSIALIFIPAFIRWGTSQYADIPLASYLLLGILLLLNRKDTSWPIFLSGLSFGIASFTKNEGIVYSLIFIISILYGVLRSKLKIDKKNVFMWLIGFLPGISFHGAVKLFAPANEFLTYKGHIGYLNRSMVILDGFIREFLNWKEWGIFWFIAIPLLILLMQRKKDFWSQFFTSFFILVFIFFFISYLFTPQDVVWHIETSFNRLLIQILPVVLFTLFFYLKNFSPWHKEISPTYLSSDSSAGGAREGMLSHQNEK